MTVRNLDFVFKPASIAVIGAGRKPQTLGAVVARNLFSGGFDGPILPVSPQMRAVEGVMTYPTIAALPLVPDLAVICTPAETAAKLVAELGVRGTKAAIVMTDGFDDGGPAGELLKRQLLEAARPSLLRVIGPNSLGIMVPGRGLNASAAPLSVRKGDIALVAQSGAITSALLDWAAAREIGFSHVVALGDKSDVDFGDMLDYLAGDSFTRAILLYIESITHPRKFMSAARTAARQKPVIVIKAGRSAEAARVAQSHTRAMAGADAVYDAAFRRAGVLRVHDLDEMFDAAETVAMGVPALGDRVAIVTNGGGIGVLATDTLVASGGRLAELSPATLARMDGKMPRLWSRGNPVNIRSDADAARYAEALDAILDDSGQDAVLVLHSPSALADSDAAARAVVETLAKHPSRNAGRKHPVLTSWLGDRTAGSARRLFTEHRVPTYETPGDAVRAFLHLVEYRRNQVLLMETPASVPEEFVPDTARVRALFNQVLETGREWLSEFEAKQALEAYGVPVVPTRQVATPEEAAAAAAALGCPVAVKILAHGITHKSDVGGVALKLSTPEQVRSVAQTMLDRVRHHAPEARIEGFTVQTMASGPDSFELIVGMTEDPDFGPVLLFGEGGTRVEVVADRALALPPLNFNLAQDLMSRTRVWRELQGYRTRPPAALDAIALALMKVSQLVSDFAEVRELDINPLFADPNGVLALDARIRICRTTVEGASRLAIRPYPKEQERDVVLKDGRSYRVRPVRPEDEPLFQRMFEKMTPNDIRLRFFAPMKRMSHQVAARLTQIDYDREMGLVALAEENGQEEMFGVVRIAADPDNIKAEYAVMVRSDMKGCGLGFFLMNAIIDYGRARGLQQIYGEVLRENTNMLGMCRRLGFVRRENSDEPGVVEVSINLTQAQDAAA